MKIPVYLLYSIDYDNELENVLFETLDNLLVSTVKRVLVKPNFIANKNTHISCTNPYLLFYVCKYFVSRGCEVIVGDSPAFGSAKKIARAIGFQKLINNMPVDIVEFTKQKIDGYPYSIAREINDVDLIVNVAKFKAHNQMGMSLCVKNFFGIVVGYDKLKAHISYGNDHLEFANIILDILKYLPSTINILDGIVAMESKGPLDGYAKKLNLIGVSQNPIALDTVIYTMIGATPKQIPLWYVSNLKNLIGSKIKDIQAIKQKNIPDTLYFHFPTILNDISFRPDRVIKSFIKRFISKTF